MNYRQPAPLDGFDLYPLPVKCRADLATSLEHEAEAIRKSKCWDMLVGKLLDRAAKLRTAGYAGA